MSHVFGPVPSRRLGRSLGVDPVPSKACNWNCVYCQLGFTAPLVSKRRRYVPADEVVAEVRESLEAHGESGIDWVTFVGSGETALHADLGAMIRAVKRMTQLPVAVITNGSLLSEREVREELSAADAVLPSLDAGTEELYLRINRPMPGWTHARLVDGLAEFRRSYRGRLWLEVMLLSGLNDSEDALHDLAACVRRIDPDEVHLNVPTRPPAEPWVEPADEKGLERAAAILGDVARVVPPAVGTFDLKGCADAVEAILQVIRRHPMSEEEVLRSLARWPDAQIRDTLERLAASGRAQVVRRGGRRFWCAASGRYVEKRDDERASSSSP
jgi:wyosine [tRNA(Phe)-imidazoG37] synthetase (radical SAM superfamily)